jgi:hypothetical protein
MHIYVWVNQPSTKCADLSRPLKTVGTHARWPGALHNDKRGRPQLISTRAQKAITSALTPRIHGCERSPPEPCRRNAFTLRGNTFTRESGTERSLAKATGGADAKKYIR